MTRITEHPLLLSSREWIDPVLEVADAGGSIEFSLHDAFGYHGYDAPGGIALGWRLLQKAFAILSPARPPERRAVSLFTSFPGLGLRDVMELTTRLVSEGRFELETDYEDPRAQEGVAGRFYYRFSYRGESVELAPAPGYPGDEFVRLGRASKRPGCPGDELERWTAAKFSLANVLLAAPADAVIRVL